VRDKSFFRFLIVGGCNTAVGLALIFLLRQFLPDTWANLLGFVLYTPLTYFTHKKMTFAHAGPNGMAFVRYVLAVIVGYGVNYGVLVLALALAVNPYLAQTLAVGSCAVVSFLLFRFCVFRPRNSHAV
jgi:putative flippase GtrA